MDGNDNWSEEQSAGEGWGAKLEIERAARGGERGDKEINGWVV